MKCTNIIIVIRRQFRNFLSSHSISSIARQIVYYCFKRTWEVIKIQKHKLALFNILTATPIIWISNEPAKIWYGKLKQSRPNRDNNFNCHQTFYLHFNIRIVYHKTEYFFLISFRLTSHFRINSISFLTTTNNGNLSLRPKTTRRMHH